jgi:MtN3 and saliva related transmembrane protein
VHRKWSLSPRPLPAARVQGLDAVPPWTITAIGLAAGTLTTGAFVPQVVRVWRLRRAEEISFTTFLVLSIGSLAWLTYGLLVSSWPVILANSATFVLVLTILCLKVVWDRRSVEGAR